MGCTPLHKAVQFGRAQVTELLLSRAADVNSVNKVSTGSDLLCGGL